MESNKREREIAGERRKKGKWIGSPTSPRAHVHVGRGRRGTSRERERERVSLFSLFSIILFFKFNFLCKKYFHNFNF